MTKAGEGMRVYVFVEGDDEDGPVYGTITSVEPLLAEGTDHILSGYFPTITLDDGRAVNGMECYWYPTSVEKP
jgi:hypothetical protein